MGRILKSYFFWTYERGSFHYDVMVTLILAFIFVTPFLWNYGDRPQPDALSRSSVAVKVTAPGQFVYSVPESALQSGSPVEKQLAQQINAISGSVILDNYEPVKGSDGKVLSYQVWAHR